MKNKIFTIAVAGLEAAKKTAEWGTCGKDGFHPLVYVRLIDCSTEHLQAILRTQHHISDDYRMIILGILSGRGVE